MSSLNQDKITRLVLGTIGLLLTPISSALTWSLFFVAPRPKGIVECGARILVEELAIIATLFFSLTFLWAICANLKMKKTLHAVAIKFIWILTPVLLVCGFGLVCIMILGL